MRLPHELRNAAIAASALLTLGGLTPCRAADAGLKVTDAWVRMAPPSATTHAAYLTIVNEGRQTQELVAAGAEGYDNIEIHNTTVTNGVASMRRVESVAVPAGGKIEFKPGGLHLMLIDAKKPLEHGALIPIRLGFRKGTKIETEAIVINNGPKGDAEASHHDHSGPGDHKAH